MEIGRGSRGPHWPCAGENLPLSIVPTCVMMRPFGYQRRSRSGVESDGMERRL